MQITYTSGSIMELAEVAAVSRCHIDTAVQHSFPYVGCNRSLGLPANYSMTVPTKQFPDTALSPGQRREALKSGCWPLSTSRVHLCFSFFVFFIGNEGLEPPSHSFPRPLLHTYAYSLHELKRLSSADQKCTEMHALQRLI